MKIIIYYASYLVFVLFPLIIFIGIRKQWNRSFLLLLSLLCTLFIWARFIEPHIIIVQEQTLDLGIQKRIALISDLHLGVYKKELFLSKVLQKIEALQPDFILIAGDLTYEPKKEDIQQLFSPLKEIHIPVYVVLGNHDVEKPGPPIRDTLEQVLKGYNVNVLNNNMVSLENFTLVGLGSNWNEEDDVTLLDNFNEQDTVIVLTHNPDTTLKYNNKNADLTLTGHTHCGQIRLPFIYRFVLPVVGNFDKGLYNTGDTSLFITCGVGETGLPMRLFNPPQIDVLNL